MSYTKFHLVTSINTKHSVHAAKLTLSPLYSEHPKLPRKVADQSTQDIPVCNLGT